MSKPEHQRAKQINPPPRLARELKTVLAMIEIYCRAHHASTDGLCGSCRELYEYAQRRLSACPFQEDKTSCGNCAVHCYKPSMREQIKKVMRFSGPKMLFRHPFLAIAHLLDERRKPLTAADTQGSEENR